MRRSAHWTRFAGLETVHRYLATAIDSTSLVFNAILLYLILYHSRFYMKEFKWIFMMTCVGDTLLSIVVLLGQPYIMFDGRRNGGFMFIVSNGPFSRRSPTVDHIASTAFCSMLHVNIVIVVCQFVWRNSLICGEESLIHVTKKKALFPIAWCLVQLATAAWCWTVDQDEIREEGLYLLRKNGWEFDNDAAPYPGMTPGRGFKTIAHHVFYLSSTILGYCVIVWCQVRAITFISQRGVAAHRKTRKAHSEINRALIALAISPLCSLVPTALMIGSNALQIPLGPVSAYISLGMTIITLANPLVTVYFVKPYRDGLLCLLRLRDKNQ
ncbi:7TM GPCR protein, partial [Aphelenchoides avenae]